MLDNIENGDMASTSKGSQQQNNGHKSHRVIEIQTSKHLKDTVGDYIDSSGGTIDAIEYIDQHAELVQEVSNQHQFIKNYSSVKKLEIGIERKHNYTQRDDSSGKKTKNKLRELTQLTNDNCVKDDDIEYPLKPGQALRNFMKKLSDFEKGEILDYRKIWYLGLDSKKVNGSPLKPYNYGYDDDKGDYKVVINDHIGYRFEVIEPLGKGSFGQALRCFDHERKEYVALKIIRNKKKFQHQAGVEVKILKHLKENDKNDDNNIIKINDYIVFRKHLCISFELLSIDLYEFIKNNNFRGVSLGLIRRFAIQILQALRYVKNEKVIHCDLKPENILLKNINKSGIKIIDFGSS